MPVYQYRCARGHESEISRRLEDASKDAHCPECGEPARRLFKLRGVGFKGPGFYATDYGRVTSTRSRLD